MADGTVFERGVLREEFSRADLRTVPANFEFSASTVEGQARQGVPVALDISSAMADEMRVYRSGDNDKEPSPQDAFELKTDGRDFKAGNPYRIPDDQELRRLAEARGEKEEDPLLARMTEQMMAQWQKDQAVLDALSAADWRDLGDAVAKSYDAKIKEALARGDMSAVTALRREAETASRYADLRANGFSGDATRSALQGEGFSIDEIHKAEHRIVEMRETARLEQSGQTNTRRVTASESVDLVSKSTTDGAEILGDVRRIPSPIQNSFKEAVEHARSPISPDPAPAKPPSITLDIG